MWEDVKLDIIQENKTIVRRRIEFVKAIKNDQQDISKQANQLTNQNNSKVGHVCND